jgi:non-lysosomal glucosylceramidase
MIDHLSYGWTRRFDEPDPDLGSSIRFNWKLLLDHLPMILRILKHNRKERKMGRLPFMDTIREQHPGPIMGVPLGGLGGGSITRGWRGDFVRWQLQAGIVNHETVLADQFSLWTQRPGEESYSLVLNPNKPDEVFLNAWEWSLPASKGSYQALFPRAWTMYEEPVPGLHLSCKQLSPIIPHEYQISSTPAAVFSWALENTSHTPITTSLMFTFQNGAGMANDMAGGHYNQVFEQEAPGGKIVGIKLHHIHRQPKPLEAGQKLSEQQMFIDLLTFAIAAQATQGVDITYHGRFITNSSGLDVWSDFSLDGKLVDYINEKPSTEALSIGAALCCQVTVPAGENRVINFALAWDMPVARFGSGSGWYRRYTKFYGQEGNAADQIVRDALLNFTQWENQIDSWQKPILDDPGLPDWYKSALFNETYYLVDGGTIWTAGKEFRESTLSDTLPEPDIGHFAYLESFEYRMYNTYDVHFYASWALAMLWPELELSLQQDFLHAIDVENLEENEMWYSGKKAPRKVRGIIPHDLGSPTVDPWHQVNAYLNQDVSRWKDLNSKFVLMVYRDYLITKNNTFLQQAFPKVVKAINALAQFDRDGDGMIENDGYPDQTYDTWSAAGPSAYTGGLWLACLGAAAAMAEILGEKTDSQSYREWQSRAQSQYESHLWNGEYYQYDSSQSQHHDSIMADQLAGEWYVAACNLPSIVPHDHAVKAFKKIYDFNVKQYYEGDWGAVNGMRPDGRVDGSNIQSSEMWTGTTYALAAAMLQAGLEQESFITAKGVYQSVYTDFGLWFQTPEAINYEGVIRALGYMRPLAIWAIQWAYQRRQHGFTG